MTKDEALRLALEDLDSLASYADTCELFLKETHPGEAYALRQRVTNSIKTITAIKAALEAKDEPCCYGGIAHDCHAGKGCKIAERLKTSAKAKDEPVEFFDWYDNAHWGNEDFKEGCHRAWNAAIKYTTPPQRKPLTDEQILAIDCMTDKTWAKLFARAIEAAHGIKREA